MTLSRSEIENLLSNPIKVTRDQIDFFSRNGFIKLKHVFPEEFIEYMQNTIVTEVQRLNTQEKALDERDTYGKAFLQVMNMWTQSESVKEIVFSKRLARIASELMEVDGVRLYHDQALFKEPGGGITPWHADQFYWPLETDKTITVWIPLQPTPLEMGPLEFAAQSFQLLEGCELKISDESQQKLQEKLTINNFQHVIESFEIGEVSFHSGWIFHRAGANETNTMRSLMTIIYMDKNMKLKKPVNKNQVTDWKNWCNGAEIGKVIDTFTNPILYSK